MKALATGPTLSDLLRFVAAATAISLTSVVSTSAGGDLRAAGKEVSFRPPPIVFAVVWPILYVTTGVAWAKTKFDPEFVFLVGLLCLWLLFYSNVEKDVHPRIASLVIIISSALFAWYLAAKARRQTFLVFPLAAWLSFASAISITEAAS
tara:strand:- start:486 stop:935 length:450 start_codon:yes stop_codon:yes gene_type:complete